MKKVILTKEQAKAIENRVLIFDVSMECKIKGFERATNKCLNELSTKDFASALINGYEVEETPEDEIFKVYKESFEKRNKNVLEDKMSNEYYYFDGKRDGILIVLELMDIKIKGINR